MRELTISEMELVGGAGLTVKDVVEFGKDVYEGGTQGLQAVAPVATTVGYFLGEPAKKIVEGAGFLYGVVTAAFDYVTSSKDSETGSNNTETIDNPDNPDNPPVVNDEKEIIINCNPDNLPVDNDNNTDDGALYTSILGLDDLINNYLQTGSYSGQFISGVFDSNYNLLSDESNYNEADLIENSLYSDSYQADENGFSPQASYVSIS